MIDTVQQVEDANELEVTLNRALEAGYRHFDTAFFHRNEAAIGKVFQKWFTSGKIRREDLYIVSKVSMEPIQEYQNEGDGKLLKSLFSFLQSECSRIV